LSEMPSRALREFVLECGRNLRRPDREVEPYVGLLAENWYDNPEDLSSAGPEELKALGIPMRFASALIEAANSGGNRDGGKKGGGGKSGGKHDRDGKGKDSKSKAHDRDGKGKGKDRQRDSWDYDSDRKGKGGDRKADRKGEKADRKGDKGWGKDDRRGGDKGYGKGKDDGGEYNKIIQIKNLDKAFKVKGAVIGAKGANLQHIKEATGAAVYVCGENGEKITMEIKAESKAALQEAEQLCKNLLKTVYEDFETWQKEQGEEPEFQHTIDLPDCDEAFGQKPKLIGRKGENLHHIQDETGAKLYVKGDPPDALRLEIKARSQENLDTAISLAQELIDSVQDQYKEWSEKGDKGDEGSGDEGADKGKGKGKRKGKKGRGKGKDREGDDAEEGEFSGTVDLQDSDPTFGLRGRLLGKKGQNVHHIEDETKAKVVFEEKCVKVRGSTEAILKEAMTMVQDLIDSVAGEYEEWLQKKAGNDDNKRSDEGGRKESGKGGEGKGKKKGKDRKRERQDDDGGGQGSDNQDSDRLRKVITVFHSEEAFKIRGKIIGQKGSNLQYIQDQSKAKIDVKGKDGDKLTIEVSADESAALEEGVNMVQDLIDSTQADYDDWLKDGGRDDGGDRNQGGSRKGGKSKGKGKGGKDKSRRRDDRDLDDGPPATKRRREY